MYLPDGISRFNVGGSEYLITANEGDARADYGATNNEETTIGAITYSLDPIVFPYASVMKTNANLGKLKCTNKLIQGAKFSILEVIECLNNFIASIHNKWAMRKNWFIYRLSTQH